MGCQAERECRWDPTTGTECLYTGGTCGTGGLVVLPFRASGFFCVNFAWAYQQLPKRLIPKPIAFQGWYMKSPNATAPKKVMKICTINRCELKHQLNPKAHGSMNHSRDLGQDIPTHQCWVARFISIKNGTGEMVLCPTFLKLPAMPVVRGSLYRVHKKVLWLIVNPRQQLDTKITCKTVEWLPGQSESTALHV